MRERRGYLGRVRWGGGVLSFARRHRNKKNLDGK